jgi:hypothetical protein
MAGDSISGYAGYVSTPSQALPLPKAPAERDELEAASLEVDQTLIRWSLGLSLRERLQICVLSSIAAILACDKQDGTPCSSRRTQSACEPEPDLAEQDDRCYWLDVEVRTPQCEVLEREGRCVSLPWSGDGVSLGGACGAGSNSPGVAYQPSGDNFETIHREIYGGDIQQLEDWHVCRYAGTDPVVCDCFCEE